MLSVQRWPPDSGITNSMFGLSSLSCTASPDHPTITVESPLVMSLVYSLPVKPRIWPESEASPIFSIAAMNSSVVAVSGSAPMRGRHQAHAVTHLREHGDLALVDRIEQVVHRLGLALDLVLAVDDPGQARLPGHREVARRVERRLLEPRDQVLGGVGHFGLVELLHVAEADHARSHPVGDRVDVAPARVAALVLLADLAEELGVVVDLFDVLDLGAVLLLEVLERSAVLFDVQRPVREVERVGDLALGDRLRLLGFGLAAASCLGAAGRQIGKRGDAECPRRAAAQQPPAADFLTYQPFELPVEIAHSVSPSESSAVSAAGSITTWMLLSAQVRRAASPAAGRR